MENLHASMVLTVDTSHSTLIGGLLKLNLFTCKQSVWFLNVLVSFSLHPIFHYTKHFILAESEPIINLIWVVLTFVSFVHGFLRIRACHATWPCWHLPKLATVIRCTAFDINKKRWTVFSSLLKFDTLIYFCCPIHDNKVSCI